MSSQTASSWAKYMEWGPSKTAKDLWSSRRTWTRPIEELDEARPCHQGGHLDQDPHHRQSLLSSGGGPSWPIINVVLDKAEGAAIDMSADPAQAN